LQTLAEKRGPVAHPIWRTGFQIGNLLDRLTGGRDTFVSMLLNPPGPRQLHRRVGRSSRSQARRGSNSSGQLGAPVAMSSSASPVDVVTAPTSAAVTGGQAHTCALTQTGDVSCWGDNSEGQLGPNSSAPMSSAPVMVTF
jgi:hypothetical protein